jgi:SPP1 gp7 family putative phage head morphogenesis protein
VFDRAVRHIFNKNGFTPEMLADPEIADLIEETYNAIDQAVQTSIRTETPPELTSALENNAFVFSGFKTYHQLSEVGLSLTRRDGSVKPFKEFREDVEAINSRYNGSYLYAEYNHAIHASQMAVKWNDFVKDGDEYYLQYRTAGDDRVREAHARLDGTTLPPSDPFWNEFLPPNGWNCRCQTVQVLRDDYALSDSQRAIENGRQCTSEPKQQMFRFNPGKEMKIFPPKHPYLPRGCGDCGNHLNFAYNPNSAKCKACKGIQYLADCHSERDMLCKLQGLIELKGSEKLRRLREIILERTFKKVDGHKGVMASVGDSDPDYDRLISCADKCVEKGYDVYLLPNPKGLRTPDVILSGRNYIAAYDIKTIMGEASVGNRLTESIGQTNRVILNMAVTYNARSLAHDIKSYFETNESAEEVMILKGHRQISVFRKWALSKNFIPELMKQYGAKK